MSDSLQSTPEPRSAPDSAPVRNILLVDDSDFERFAIRAAVEGLTDFRVCGEARNGVEAIEKAAELKPDLVVMDLAMPLMNGLEASTVLKKSMPGVPIVLLTLYAQEVPGPRSTAFGVATVLSKVDGLAPLLECLDRMLSTSGSE
jgi:two-component system vancomycin resistance associated response regulator VraR